MITFQKHMVGVSFKNSASFQLVKSRLQPNNWEYSQSPPWGRVRPLSAPMQAFALLYGVFTAPHTPCTTPPALPLLLENCMCKPARITCKLCRFKANSFYINKAPRSSVCFCQRPCELCTENIVDVNIVPFIFTNRIY